MKKDQIYRQSLANIANFNFDTDVADVFADMIERSVPGYPAIITMIETLTQHYAQPQSHLYDLGCSLGAATLSMQRGLNVAGCKIVAVDNSPAMITLCKNNLQSASLTHEIEILCEDLLNVDITNASVVVLNFTLQFITQETRAELLKTIYEGMRPGGVLILSEKVQFADQHLNDLLIHIYHDFKRANGYSDLEVSQKRTALEKVLIPETIPTHRERLLQAGFSSVDVWFQCFNFMSMLAVK